MRHFLPVSASGVAETQRQATVNLARRPANTLNQCLSAASQKGQPGKGSGFLAKLDIELQKALTAFALAGKARARSAAPRCTF